MERKICTILDNIQNIEMVDEQIIVTFKTDPVLIMLFNAYYDKNINFFESVLFPKLFKKISDINFDDGNIYKIYSASLLRANSIDVGGILRLTFNNINFEMLGQKQANRVYRIFYFKKDSNKRAKVIYNCDTKELYTVNGITDNVMFELIGKSVTLEDFQNASKFVNNISGVYISTPIINEWGSIVTRQLREEKIKERKHTTDMLYSNFVQEVSISDLKKIFNLSEHFTYSNESPIVDFVLNFAKFEETIKHSYLKSYYSLDYNYDVLYQKYTDELSNKAHDKLSEEVIKQNKLKSQYPDFNWNGDSSLTDFLTSNQKKIFKSGYIQKENMLNNFPKLKINSNLRKIFLSFVANYQITWMKIFGV